VGAQALRENPDSCYHAAAGPSDADSVNWHQGKFVHNNKPNENTRLEPDLRQISETSEEDQEI